MTYQPTFARDFGIDRTANIFEQIRYGVVKRNESWDIALAQKRGAGKSAVAIRMALMLDPNFTADHICFSVQRFVQLLTSEQRPGTVIVFDDIGTQAGGSSRKWQKQESQDLADIMQVNRTDGIITIATSLELERGEKRLRQGFSILTDPGEKLSDSETGGHGLASRIILRKRVVDVFDGSIRWHYWRYAPNGRIVGIEISHPPLPVWLGQYKRMRAEFLESVKGATTALTNKDWAGLINTSTEFLPKYHTIIKRLSDANATSHESATKLRHIVNCVKDVFGVQESTARKHINSCETSELIMIAKTSPSSKGVWLTEKGQKFALYEPNTR